MLASLKARELNSLQPFFRYQAAVKLSSFQAAKKKIKAEDQPLLGLWESMLTGKSSAVPKAVKEQYRQLGLSHLFTPSGFHLSSVLTPLNKLIKQAKLQLMLLMALGALIFTLPGLGALKRMVLIKYLQRIMGKKLGFILALLMDCLLGSLDSGALSFTYSFLFLGIIYSGVSGVGLVIWFFIAQSILAYFQGGHISLLMLLFSPLLNTLFGLMMPLLFLMSFPLWSWQIESGIFIFKILQRAVDLVSQIVFFFPRMEVNIALLFLMLLILYRRTYLFLIMLTFFCSSLNLDLQKIAASGRYEFHPQGAIIKSKENVTYFSDGKCRSILIRGFWWEKCSPLRRAPGRLSKKLSYPSSKHQKSFLL